MIDSKLEQPPADADHVSPSKLSAATVGADFFAPMLAALERICAEVLRLERDFARPLGNTHRVHRQSARNLVHYLALRQHDLRELQQQLAAVGLSSLGRTESHVLAGLDAVHTILCRLTDQAGQPLEPQAETISFAAGQSLLRAHTEALLGPRPLKRGVRIMVTMPSEAAQDYTLVKQLLAHGMDCMRIGIVVGAVAMNVAR